LWRKKSAPELMGAELLIMFVLIVFGEWNNFITSFLTLHKNGGVVFGNRGL